MNFVDRLEIAGTRRRAEDGALLVDARVARTGIQFYAGYEVGKPEIPVVRVYRDEKQVFSRDSMASFAHRPVTNDHPPEAVTADNWKKYAVGGTSDQVARDGDFIRIPMMISDAMAIADIESGKRELSAGYRCELEWTPGTMADGSPFDARQINIRANHVAICDHARGGSNLRIGDNQPWGSSPIQTMDTGVPKMAKLITLADGMPIDITNDAQTEAVIRRLEKQLSDSTASVGTLTRDHATALAAKDSEIGRLTAELKVAKDAAPTPVSIQAMVIDRANLFAVAGKLIKDFKPESVATKDNATIRRECVTAVMGADAVKDRNDDVVTGMFDALVKSAGGATDPFKMVVQDNANQPAVVGDKKAFNDYVANLTKPRTAA